MKRLFLAISVLATPALLFAKGAGTSSGLALLRDSGARSSALGEAFTSVGNDITAMDFNPASLASLASGHASLQYEKGAFDDAFSKAMVGARTSEHGSFGLGGSAPNDACGNARSARAHPRAAA